MKILIVEDDFLSRKLLAMYLGPFGEVDIATNGKEAVMAVGLAFEEHAPYDIICLDIMMPQLDGISTLKKIRQMETAQGLTLETGAKIFMTTALSDKERVIEAAKAACNAYLIKPITKTRIIEELAKVGISPATP